MFGAQIHHDSQQNHPHLRFHFRKSTFFPWFPCEITHPRCGFHNGSQVAANLITYSATIGACGRGEEWQKGLELLQQLTELELRINVMLG